MESIVIAGGGISGLYLAYRLLRRGERRIHIYEATERLGGSLGIRGSNLTLNYGNVAPPRKKYSNK